MLLSITLGSLSTIFGGLYLYERRQARALRVEQIRHEESILQLAQRDRLRGEFLSTVSHELRTTLTSIHSSLGLLNCDAFLHPNIRGQELLRIALANSERLVRLTSDLLDLERMESGRTPLRVRRCDLSSVIHHAVETMSGLAEAEHIQIQFHSAFTNSPLFLDGDPDRLQQVVINLLSNAIKFSPAASTIRIGSRTVGDSFVVTVSDEGRGIPEDKLEAVFERFQQVDSSDTRRKDSSGLGLAICRSIVQQHGGIIWASQNPGTGVTFSMKLPGIAASLSPEPTCEAQLAVA
jgi:signal transduction histidine kinase